GEFAPDVDGGAHAAEFFFFKNRSFARDLASGVVRSHQGEEDDLEHDQPGDEAAEVQVEGDGFGLRFEGRFGGGDGFGESPGLFDAVEFEDDDEKGEADENGELQEKLPFVAEENFPAPGEE